MREQIRVKIMEIELIVCVLLVLFGLASIYDLVVGNTFEWGYIIALIPATIWGLACINVIYEHNRMIEVEERMKHKPFIENIDDMPQWFRDGIIEDGVDPDWVKENEDDD